jgi:predicted nucleotidyltransferase
MDFANSTDLDSPRLERLLVSHTWPYRHERLAVRVRHSRGAEFSGTCLYGSRRIYVNLGRQNVYPYLLGTHIARSRSNRTHWWRETYRVWVDDAYQLALFVYLHELYHYLVKAAGRNPRRKEAMCDRFAARALVDYCGASVLDSHRRPVARQRWDFQDLYTFVAAAPKVGVQGELLASTGSREIPVTVHGVRTGTRRPQNPHDLVRRRPGSGPAPSSGGPRGAVQWQAIPKRSAAVVAMQQIEALSRRIASEFRPHRIILFGSHARGTATPDSDVDLLVILPFEGRAVAKSVEIRLKTRPSFPLDLIVRTPEKVRERLALGDGFLRSILESGKVLYEADHG